MNPHSFCKAGLLGAALAAAMAHGPVAAAQGAEPMRLAATRSVMLDVAEGDQCAVMVGERGHVLVSESRSDWRQIAEVPTRATLTAVAASGDRIWAVGHDGVIVHSADGGLNWTLQRQDPWRPLADDEEFDPRRGVPLLDVLILDADNGLAVGAYSLMLRTRDGGQSWERVQVTAADDGAADADWGEVDMEDEDTDWTFSDEDLMLDEESDPHLNGIARTGDGSLFVVGERGAAFRSRDRGETWERLQLPYEGSMFGVLGYDGQRVLAYGMRGNVFESDDLGETWRELDSGTDQSLMGGAALPNGGAVLVGGNGVVALRADANAPFAAHTYTTSEQETPVLAAVLPRSVAAHVVGGEKGVGRFQLRQQSGE